MDTQEFQEAQEDYKNFLDDGNSHTDGLYEDRIQKMLEKGENRLTVRINDLRGGSDKTKKIRK